MKFSRILVLAAVVASFAFAEINLNTATKDELMSLPGIGESKAEAIMEYRKNNKFNSVEDIKNVKGIGNKRFEMLKDDLAVSGKTDTSNLKSVAEKEKAKAMQKANKKSKQKAEKAKKEIYDINDDAAKKTKKTKDETEKMTKEAKDGAKKAKAETKEAKENAKKAKDEVKETAKKAK